MYSFDLEVDLHPAVVEDNQVLAGLQVAVVIAVVDPDPSGSSRVDLHSEVTSPSDSYAHAPSSEKDLQIAP